MLGTLLGIGIRFVERGWVPDAGTRLAIRKLCAQRLADPEATTHPDRQAARTRFLESLHTGPIALVPELANDQHYELPAEFFSLVLGPHRKYSSCLFANPQTSLGDAEAAALAETCEHANLQDGQDILELGCGWGSLSLWMAEHYPQSRITAVSNSASQRQFIEAEAQKRNLTNLRIVTADMNDFEATPGQYDRVVSVEMFEHMRNYERLLQRVAQWLRPDGRLFVHHFCHKTLLYEFETEGSANWMGQHFFTGGLMPSEKLLHRFSAFQVERQWSWGGQHYQQTAECWLKNLDQYRPAILEILATAYGPDQAVQWFHRWRIFMLAVSELFGYANGKEWFVTHLLMKPIPPARQS